SSPCPAVLNAVKNCRERANCFARVRTRKAEQCRPATGEPGSRVLSILEMRSVVKYLVTRDRVPARQLEQFRLRYGVKTEEIVGGAP
ncbi:MAG: hypothetical protein NUV54_01225, partial [Candidatus Taylorbacteria bacterium]|nr:hypothetical protein [Candidatus Taylorbacteria bacterium]